MESIKTVRFFSCKPEIEYTFDETNQDYIKSVMTDKPECKIVDFLQLSDDQFQKLKNPFYEPIVEFTENEEQKYEATIDLQAWTDPFVNLSLGITPSAYLVKFLDTLDPLVTSTPPTLTTDSLFSTFSDQYSMLALSISFLSFMKFDPTLVSSAQARLEKEYP